MDSTTPENPEDADAPFPLGDVLQRELRDGGCAAVICNTVARAQAVYIALQRIFPRGTHSPPTRTVRPLDGYPVLDLFHARYRFAERQAREERALLRFGKPERHRRTSSATANPCRRPCAARTGPSSSPRR